MKETEIIEALTRIETIQSCILSSVDEMKVSSQNMTARIKALEEQQAECKGRQKYQAALIASISAAASAGVTGAAFTLIGGS